jgi:hypothetical protein
VSIGLDDLADLREEFLDRGFRFLSTGRANRYINLGYLELCDEYDWPFLEQTSSGTMPRTIADLGKVESVVNTTDELKIQPLDRRIVSEMDPALDDVGTAEFYYISSGNVVNVYPANTSDTFRVRYWEVPDELTSDSSTPVVPSRWRYLIVENAARRAYQDSDNRELSQMCAEEYQRGLIKMIEMYAVQQHDRPDEIQVVASEDLGYWTFSRNA